MQNKTMARTQGMDKFQPFCSVIKTPLHHNKTWCGMSFSHLVEVHEGETRNCEWQDAYGKVEAFWEKVWCARNWVAWRGIMGSIILQNVRISVVIPFIKINQKDRYKIKEFVDMEKQHQWIPYWLKLKECVCERFLHHLLRKTGGILTSHPFLHLHLWIVGWHLNRWVVKRGANFVFWLALLTMQMEVKRCFFFFIGKYKRPWCFKEKSST